MRNLLIGMSAALLMGCQSEMEKRDMAVQIRVWLAQAIWQARHLRPRPQFKARRRLVQQQPHMIVTAVCPVRPRIRKVWDRKEWWIGRQEL